MKTVISKFLIGLLIFVTSLIISIFSLIFDYSKELWGLGALIGFFLLFLTFIPYLKYFKKKITTQGVIIIAIIAILLVTIGIAPSTKFIIKTLPSMLCLLLGVLAAFLFDKFNGNKKIIYPSILLIIPILFSLNIYSLWVHKVEFGNFYGEVSEKIIVPFEFTNKKGEIINNESLIGKVVLLDFWFINCGPCWVKFPELERIHEKYKSNPLVNIYAVNRPMSRDKPMECFTKIEEKGFSFPVLQSTQEVIDLFSVYKYPTVILLNQNGEVSFMGNIEEVEKKIESLLPPNY